MLVCLNGRFIPREDAQVSINDGAFLYGDSLFETLKACGNRVLLQRQHLDRLARSAQLLGISCPRQNIETALTRLAAALPHPHSRIRLTLSRGPYEGLQFPAEEEAWFLLTAVPLAPAASDAGVTCVIAPNRRVNPLSHLPQMKRGNYADCLYARNHARWCGADEALFIDQHGNLLEGATSNLFALIDRRLVTPPTGELILDGIMRRQVIAAGNELGILCVERPLSLQEVQNADEAFLTNSIIDLQPISSIDSRQIRQGEYWKRLRKTLTLRIES
jgi:branched-subunit amino acid aminotransferase/4-amino-4-deoxychorismate lyase